MTTTRESTEGGGALCLNPACNCAVPASGEYCGEYCRLAEVRADSEYARPEDIERGAGCRCGHMECQA
ncbi:MAG: hypothetical protein ACKV2V_16725 [Blastocatellia bacterium]